MIKLLKVFLLFTVITYVQCGKYFPPGYSYAKFSGPVSGPEHEIIVKDLSGKGHGHGHTVDYVAKPDYSFSYGVEDPKTKVSQSRKETRNGDVVHGEYSVVEPDGTLRLVKYTADKKNGFQAQVITSGKPIVHDHAPAAAPAVHEKQDIGHEQEHVSHHSHSNHVEPVKSSHSQSHDYSDNNNDSDGDEESSHESYYTQGGNDDHDNDDEEEYY